MPSYKICCWSGIQLAELYKVHSTNLFYYRDIPKKIKYRRLVDAGMLVRHTKKPATYTISPFAVELLKNRKLI